MLPIREIDRPLVRGRVLAKGDFIVAPVGKGQRERGLLMHSSRDRSDVRIVSETFSRCAFRFSPT